MTLEDKIIKQKGIGKYVGKIETDLGKMDIYEKVIELMFSSGKYAVRMFDNPFCPKNKVEVKIDCGTNLKFAKKVYKQIIKEDEEEKQNLIYKKFSRN